MCNPDERLSIDSPYSIPLGDGTGKREAGEVPFFEEPLPCREVLRAKTIRIITQRLFDRGLTQSATMLMEPFPEVFVDGKEVQP